MADVIVANPGQLNGEGDRLAGMMKVFSGEVLTAFEQATVTMDKHQVRTISNGKSASFPCVGRATAAYLTPGGNLDDIRENIIHGEKIIVIDGLLTTSQLITDIDEAMMHYDIRSEYSRQMGEVLALKADAAVLAEAIKMTVANKENITGLGKGKVVNVTTTATDKGITANLGLEVVARLLEIKAEMTRNRVPQADRYVYVTPEVYSALVISLVAINRDYGGLGSIADGGILKIAGFTIVEVPHLVEGGANKTGIIQGEGHDIPETIGTATKDDVLFVVMHRSAVGTVKLKDLATERARRAELQADMIIARYAMGHGGLRPESAYVGVWKVKA